MFVTCTVADGTPVSTDCVGQPRYCVGVADVAVRVEVVAVDVVGVLVEEVLKELDDDWLASDAEADPLNVLLTELDAIKPLSRHWLGQQ